MMTDNPETTAVERADAASGAATGDLGQQLASELADDQRASRFAALVYAGTTRDAASGLAAPQLAADLRETMQFVTDKPQLRHKIRIRPRAAGSGAVIEILNDDMPFLVDSVLGELQARGLSVHLLAHPIFKTTRNAAGQLQAILGPADRHWNDGQQESLIVAHVDPMPPELAAELGRSLTEILGEVRIAVADWRHMLKRIDLAISDLEVAPRVIPQPIRAECVKFLRWMQDGHFTLLGLMEVALTGGADHGALDPVAGSGLGLLRDVTKPTLTRDGNHIAMADVLRDQLSAPVPVTVSKCSLVSRVHRRVPMDYVSITTYAPSGAPSGELRIVGLFTSRAYHETASSIPLVRHKIEAVLGALRLPGQSHSAKALLSILDTFPRDELMQIEARDLSAWSSGILDLETRPRVRVFVRHDRFDRFLSVLVFAPRDRWTTAVREKISALLGTAFNGRVTNFNPYFSDGPLVRAHFTIANAGGPFPAADLAALEANISKAIRTWNDRLTEALTASGAATRYETRYKAAFPAAYSDTFEPARAVEDMRRIDELHDKKLPIAIDFYRNADDPACRVRAAIYRFGEPIRLSERVPILENLGFSVIDERSYQLTPDIDGRQQAVALHDMELETTDAAPIDIDTGDRLLEDAFAAVFVGDADNDVFNRLTIAAGANWREAALLRAYASYQRQLQSPFGLRYLGETLVRHGGIARDLIELFHIRFDPDRFGADASARANAELGVRKRIAGALANIPSLDEDRILRTTFNLIDATVRTNAYQVTPDGRAPGVIAMKLDSHAIEAAPQPRPFREIWVYAPGVEAVHLRFAPVARGGIRWSDRAQDFRTEVLGLVRAQIVKNAVIVPSGAKGGFLPKQLPRGGTRDAINQEALSAYRRFISALLDITDNIVDGKIVPPARVVRRDGDDPYLVVAADKGTASFSDVANGIAAAHDFWLGDAFASGGSVGYDHKQMGITARGAWECVKRHFREIDIDIQSTPIRVAGVGDMSGDVFGNGMLLSEHLKLVAAFDHRDIFIDPDPDTAVSFAERKRLFEQPRSSWQDYDRGKISAGGGVFSRSAKSVPLSPAMRALFDLKDEAVTPQDLMKAILKLPVDLMWFGGIGTYVKSATESDDQVGDRANDAVRVSPGEFGARVVGEGANLALTQKGRIELARRGVRLNTDSIDNSAGVNSSDIEVNIKIALGDATRSGALPPEPRKALLASMTPFVAQSCLVNNYDQSLAISIAQRDVLPDAVDFMRLMRDLERRRLLDRRLESLPSDRDMLERQRSCDGLTRPELAILLSYAKIAMTDDLLASAVPDQPYVEPLLSAYFAPRLVAEFGSAISSHRLRREIIATALTNATINRCGPQTPARMAEESGRAPAEVAVAYLAAARIFDIDATWKRIDALDGQVRGEAQNDCYRQVQRLLRSAMSELLAEGQLASGFDARVAALATVAAAIRTNLPTLGATVVERFDTARKANATLGLPAELASELAMLPLLAETGRIAAISHATGRPVAAAARGFVAIGEHLHLADLKAKAVSLQPTDPFDRLAIATALRDIAEAETGLAGQLLVANDGMLERWVQAGGTRLASARDNLKKMLDDATSSPSRLTVAAAQLRSLAKNA